MIGPNGKFGLWALITGASSGLGEAFAVNLAQKGFHLRAEGPGGSGEPAGWRDSPLDWRVRTGREWLAGWVAGFATVLAISGWAGVVSRLGGGIRHWTGEFGPGESGEPAGWRNSPLDWRVRTGREWLAGWVAGFATRPPGHGT